MGAAGVRIGDAVARRSPEVLQIAVSSMRDAVNEARHALATGGVVLLSPGAPSFDRYKNWEERSEDFTAIVKDLDRKRSGMSEPVGASGAWGGNRTHDLRITNALLYRLSYPGAGSNST